MLRRRAVAVKLLVSGRSNLSRGSQYDWLAYHAWIIILPDMEAYPPAIPTQQTSGLALASVICGPLGFLTAGLSGIAAVITGHMALSAIKRSGGMLKGTGMAITGLVTGYITILILPIAILAGLAAPVILKQRHAADRVEMTNNAKMLYLAMFDFDADYGSFPSDKLAQEEADFAGLTGSSVLEQLKEHNPRIDVERLLSVRRKPAGKWYYFPGLKSSDDPGKPLLVSPPVADKIVVLRVDGTASPESDASLSSMDLSSAIEIPAPVRKR